MGILPLDDNSRGGWRLQTQEPLHDAHTIKCLTGQLWQVGDDTTLLSSGSSSQAAWVLGVGAAPRPWPRGHSLPEPWDQVCLARKQRRLKMSGFFLFFFKLYNGCFSCLRSGEPAAEHAE